MDGSLQVDGLRLSFDVLRLIFEEAVSLQSTQSEASRQDTAYRCALVCWTVAGWVEPLLYRRVVLETPAQVHAFDQTLKAKPPKFLSRCVRSLWIFTDAFDGESRLSQLLVVCDRLKNLVCYGGSSNILKHIQNIPWHRGLRLDTLTLVNPTPDAYILVNGEEVKKLHIINGCQDFFAFWSGNIYRGVDVWREWWRRDDKPELRIDILTIPTTSTILWIVSGLLPAFLKSGSGRDIRIHARWIMSADAKIREAQVQWTPERWHKCFRRKTGSKMARVKATVDEPSEQEMHRLGELSDMELVKEVVVEHDPTRYTWTV